jgi:hypothetical protein
MMAQAPEPVRALLRFRIGPHERWDHSGPRANGLPAGTIKPPKPDELQPLLPAKLPLHRFSPTREGRPGGARAPTTRHPVRGFALVQLQRPIFIIGTGRCGSTLMHRMFTHHPNVAYLSGCCKLRPDLPGLNGLVMRLIDMPVFGSFVRRRFQPAEHWGFWEHYINGFSAPFRDLRSDDVRLNEKKRIIPVLERMLTKKRSRMLIKFVGWPRTSFLAEIFPDALFIHLYRDGRAVANSYLNVGFWGGWGGPQQWRWGALASNLQDEWCRYDKSFVVLAAIQWKILMDSIEEAKKSLSSGQFMDVRYEHFVADPLEAFKEILSFCGLEYPDEFRATLRRFEVENRNDKWRKDLTTRQQAMLEDCVRDHLVRYGYV